MLQYFFLFLDSNSMVRHLLQWDKYFIVNMCLLTLQILTMVMGIHGSDRKSELSWIAHGDTEEV